MNATTSEVNFSESENVIRLARLREGLVQMREEVNNHGLYQGISRLEDLRVFLESHVFAVWDFMSLLKALQHMLTCVTVPWVPTRFPVCRRLVNEIVLGEESDAYKDSYLSHFELYHLAMREVDANVHPIDTFLRNLSGGESVEDALLAAQVPREAQEFVRTTFAILNQAKPHIIAAAFTFGREDVIPDMFRSMVAGLHRLFPRQLGTFHYYLERHIEVDGDSHGPMALRMISELCGNDTTCWKEAAEAAELALRARLALWSGIQGRINGFHERVPTSH
jgi:hypothetical protein